MSWANRTNAPHRLRGQQAVERRRRVLARQPMCAQCGKRPSTIADHIVNLAQGGEDNEWNMQALCKPCHDQKTSVEAAHGVLRSAASIARLKAATRW